MPEFCPYVRADERPQCEHGPMLKTGTEGRWRCRAYCAVINTRNNPKRVQVGGVYVGMEHHFTLSRPTLTWFVKENRRIHLGY